jgi:DNA-binding response OmpR family regulator
VLIAEDDTVTRLILKHWILRWGYESFVVDNGHDAWQILQQERPPEVVIIDWAMPGIDGIELCRRLRDKSRSYYHYILMVTSRTDELDVVHALESGADDCLGKPFGEPELRARLLVGNRILAPE